MGSKPTPESVEVDRRDHLRRSLTRGGAGQRSRIRTPSSDGETSYGLAAVPGAMETTLDHDLPGISLMLRQHLWLRNARSARGEERRNGARTGFFRTFDDEGSELSDPSLR
jgi:hypothetical protein